MSMQPITIELPESVMRQLLRMAAATQQSIETLVAQSVLSNLPPSAENAPPEIQAELLAMQTLSTDELLAIAQAEAEAAQWYRHSELLEQNQEGQLSLDEGQELTDLRQTADQLMLRKAYAWALLRWRGQKLPKLKDLPTPA
jgi:hypothetical protein